MLVKAIIIHVAGFGVDEPRAGSRGGGIVTGTDSEFQSGFFPNTIGATENDSSNYVSIGVFPKEECLPVQGKSKWFKDSVGERQIPCNSGEKLCGALGFHKAVDTIITKLLGFRPTLLIISSGFDGFETDPVGHNLGLTQHDYYAVTTQVRLHMVNNISVFYISHYLLQLIKAANTCNAYVISLLEGGYDTDPKSLGLAACVDSHLKALQIPS